jgi:DNA-binding NarL/FixJ family response regulator
MPGQTRIQEDPAGSQALRVLVADDEPVLREAIADLIRSQAGLELAGAVGDADEAIALSAYDDGPTAVKMFLAGAVGYLVKGVSSGEIVEAIWRAARAQSSLSTAMTSSNLEELARSEGELRAAELALHISRDRGAA